jgi:hypothetical protein
MKIEIEIDIESIVRDEIRKYIRENIVITNKKGIPVQLDLFDSVKEKQEEVEDKDTAIFIGEYGPDKWQRRNALKIAWHEAEMKKGDFLTAEEKGEIEASLEMEGETQQKAKEEAKKKALYKAKEEEILNEVIEEEKEEETSVPKADNLNFVSSLFS